MSVDLGAPREEVTGAKINKVGKKTILSDRLKRDEGFGEKRIGGTWFVDFLTRQICAGSNF